MEDYDAMLIEEKFNGLNEADQGWQTVSYQKKNKKQSVPPSLIRASKDSDVRKTVPPAGGAVENAGVVEKKSKPKKEDIQLMRFADYFGRAFAKVSSSQFPWMKILRESSVEKMADNVLTLDIEQIPLSQISENVYKTSLDWLNQRSFDALGSFVLWSLDSILSDLVQHEGASKGSKKVVQQVSSKSQAHHSLSVAMFVVLAMVLRRKPDVLISLLPIMNENVKYQGQDKLPVMIWAIAQACQGDLIVIVHGIVSFPKARAILINGAVRKENALRPPSALEVLMRITFPAPSFELRPLKGLKLLHPTLKEVALVASLWEQSNGTDNPADTAFAIKAVAEGSYGAVYLVMTQNSDCYKLWGKKSGQYLSGQCRASLIIIKKLSRVQVTHSAKGPGLEPLKATLNSLRLKSEKALASVDDAGHKASLKEVQKYCKILPRRLSRGNGCMKAFLAISPYNGCGCCFCLQGLAVPGSQETVG
ncbi:hypothetical protein HAX54_012995 [Datura stramonium]|uniref:Uncharacterized protein n=1 Tax=Datura stramonium TaxID=4076 RepID=A0ABS8S1C6_DATST|nr:hypothetical protein [Datura stramonium]